MTMPPDPVSAVPTPGRPSNELLPRTDRTEIIGACSKCGDLRDAEYTCRDGGHTVLEKKCPNCDLRGCWRGAIDGPYGICMGCGYEDGGDPPYA